jgi:hypothetical protein
VAPTYSSWNIEWMCIATIKRLQWNPNLKIIVESKMLKIFSNIKMYEYETPSNCTCFNCLLQYCLNRSSVPILLANPLRQRHTSRKNWQEENKRTSSRNDLNIHVFKNSIFYFHFIIWQQNHYSKFNGSTKDKYSWLWKSCTHYYITYAVPPTNVWHFFVEHLFILQNEAQYFQFYFSRFSIFEE